MRRAVLTHAHALAPGQNFVLVACDLKAAPALLVPDDSHICQPLLACGDGGKHTYRIGVASSGTRQKGCVGRKEDAQKKATSFKARCGGGGIARGSNKASCWAVRGCIWPIRRRDVPAARQEFPIVPDSGGGGISENHDFKLDLRAPQPSRPAASVRAPIGCVRDMAIKCS